MSASVSLSAFELEARARHSLGASSEAIYQMVSRTIEKCQISAGTLVDVGCGSGHLWRYLRSSTFRYVGTDAVHYDGFPTAAEFIKTNLDQSEWPMEEGSADVVTAVEVIEHLENPRAFMRHLVRLAKPGGRVIITTPNQLSLLSLITLLVKKRFSAFQDVHYPAHITALLEVDLSRIALECGLRDLEIVYSCQGRIVLTPWHYPNFAARLFPRAMSDNLLLTGTKV
ncbi:MAG TPA: class I SAM-dependent methyltransferase [Pyrinomonadaceae bacterium]|nr:class I SAM-dependent methyltransferase [Pyrinomonadaceae bacterium]